MKYLFKLLLILSVVSLDACKKTPQVDAGSKCDLQRFAFNRSDNEGFGIDAVAVKANSDLFITVPDWTDLTRLVPDITVADGAKVYIDDVPYVKGNSYDFSGDTQSINVFSEDGYRKYFRIQVRKGDADIDKLIYEYIGKYSVPAVSISYAVDDKEVYTAAYGYPVDRYPRRCTPETLFRIAGVSQALCAICIMTCKENGLLSLDDTVIGPGGILDSKYTSFDKVKVKHLLSHSSGLDDSFFGLYSLSVNDIIQFILAGKLYQEYLESDNPGEKFYYSEYGYGILARIVEEVSQMPYDDYLKYVMAMAGIRDIQVGEDSADEFGEKECFYHEYDTEDDPYLLPVHEMAGAIGLIATPRDLTRLLMAIDGVMVVPDILQSESTREMFSPFPYSNDFKSYGYGWNIKDTRNMNNAYYSYGSMCGSTAICAIFPDSGVCASFTCNTSRANENFREDTEHLFCRIAEIIKDRY